MHDPIANSIGALKIVERDLLVHRQRFWQFGLETAPVLIDDRLEIDKRRVGVHLTESLSGNMLNRMNRL